MRVIPPITITDALLTSSSVIETPPAAYAAGTTYVINDTVSVAGAAGLQTVYTSLQSANIGHTPASSPTWWKVLNETYQVYSGAATYALGDKVIDATAHRVYESLVAGNIGNALSDTTKWMGSTYESAESSNRWSMFDTLRTSPSRAWQSLSVTITPGQRIDSLALLGMVGDSVSVRLQLASRPLNFDTAGYSGVNLSLAATVSSPTNLVLSADGAKLYVTAFGTRTVYQFNLTSPFNLQTAVYSGFSLNVSAQLTDLRGLAVSTDGTKLYVTGVANTVYQYTMTGGNLNGATYSTFSLAVACTQAMGLAVSTDGTKLYVADYANNSVHQYTMTGGSLSGAAYSKSLYQIPATWFYGIAVSADGTKLFAISAYDKKIIQYTFTGGDLGGAVNSGKSLIVSETASLQGVAVSADGTKLFALDYSPSVVYQYSSSDFYGVTQSLQTRELNGWFDWFFKPWSQQANLVLFDIPSFLGETVTVTLTGTSWVEIGALVIGRDVYLGEADFNAESDVLNFSTITRAADGSTSVMIPRRNVPKTNQQLIVDKSRVNSILQLRDELNAVPAVWCAVEDSTDGWFDSFQILGYYKRFTVTAIQPETARINLELEEI